MAAPVFADKDDHSEHGTKDLLARIEALEAIVGGQQSSDNAVSGFSYVAIQLVNHLWALNEAPTQGASVSAGKTLWEFYEDGTGASTVLECNGYRLHDTDINDDPAHFEQTFGCQNRDLTFTYVQTGAVQAVTFTGNGITINLLSVAMVKFW